MQSVVRSSMTDMFKGEQPVSITSEIGLYQEDEILKKWINPYYLSPEIINRIKKDSVAKPFCKYAVSFNNT